MNDGGKIRKQAKSLLGYLHYYFFTKTGPDVMATDGIGRNKRTHGKW